MPNILTIQIDLDRLHTYGTVENPTGHVGDLLAETLDRFARTDYGTGTNTDGEYNVWTHNVAHVGTARVTTTGDTDQADEQDDDQDHRGNMLYPNGQCPGCGWGLDDARGCPNPDCDGDGDKLPADQD